jgi:tRNA-dihydrouridine synthase C
MLARGALCRPDLGAAVQALYSGSPAPDFGWEDARAMLVDFLETNLRLYDTRYAINPVKQWLVYLKVYYPQAAALFAQVKRITDPDTMADALAKRDALLNAA